MPVTVKNTGKSTFSKSWDGTMYDFPPGQEVMIPDPAAAYLFGFGMGPAEREACLLRNGWLRRDKPITIAAKKEAIDMLDCFVFKKVEMGGKKLEQQTRQTLHMPGKHDLPGNRRLSPA